MLAEIIVGLIIAYILYRFFENEIRGRIAARRMGLRDKGRNPKWCCSGCETRARVGVRISDGQRVDFCWRCECILTNANDPPPDGHEDMPVEEPELEIDARGGEVIQIDAHRKKSAA